MFIQRSDRAASSTVLDTTDALSVRARVFYRERSRTAGVGEFQVPIWEVST